MEMNKVLGIVLAALMLVAVPANAALAQVAVQDDGQIVEQTTSTPFLTITAVKINGDTAEDGDELFVERGEELDIRVTIEAGTEDVRGAQIESFIAGYRYAKYERDLVSDYTKTFDLPAGKKRSFDLQLKIPVDMEKKDAKLRIVASDENSASLVIYNYQLNINGADESNAVEIRDFFISPSTTIEAGRALSFKVKVKNFGDHDLDDIKVKVSIPELDLATYETLDTLEKDETQSFEALLLRIPTDADAGTYDVIAEVEFDRFESVSETQQITVRGMSSTPSEDDGKSVIMMPESVEIVLGSDGSVYPILIQNTGDSPKTYVLSTSGVSWGSTSFEPSSVVVVGAGQSQTVYLRVSANSDAVAGDKVFKVQVRAGEETKETSVLATLKGAAKQGSDIVKVLEWALVVLVVVLIVLGLVILFKKSNKGKKKDEEEEQTYY